MPRTLLNLVALGCFDSYKIDYSQESTRNFSVGTHLVLAKGTPVSCDYENNPCNHHRVIPIPRPVSAISELTDAESSGRTDHGGGDPLGWLKRLQRRALV